MIKLSVCVLGAALSVACANSHAETPANNAPAAAAQAPRAPEPSPEYTDKKAEVTPALARKATQILREHGDEPLGTEVPFTQDGKRYTARLEEHDNPNGDPERPQGKHKGVTVYEQQ